LAVRELTTSRLFPAFHSNKESGLTIRDNVREENCTVIE
jgi:hypothetical protein